MSETIDILTAAAALPKTRADWRAEPAPAIAALVPTPQPRVAILIPCCNEEASIADVVSAFRAALPHATVYVYDNNSTDRTALMARAAGAVTRRESRQGKGHVVRRMFADVDADFFILVDGDGTYDAAAAPGMVQLLMEHTLDMVTATRLADSGDAYRPGHHFGNRLLTGIVSHVFGGGIGDVLSGYRGFSRRFVKSFPALSDGFETEAEFSIHALSLRMPMAQVAAAYHERSAGSVSKLHTYADGFRILRAIIMLIAHERPMPSFCLLAGILLLAALGSGLPVVVTFMQTGLVPRLPTALLATGLVLLASLTGGCGLILDAVARGRRELRRLAYLAIPPVRHEP
jgi:glycosyltransferase involved in cell wall biosynthesis